MNPEPTQTRWTLRSSAAGALRPASYRSSRCVLSSFLVCLLILAGFALRLYRIAYQSVWWDEAYSLHMAREGMAVMLGQPDGTVQVHWDQPPLYYGLLSLWVRLAGASELSLRYLSLCFGVLLLPAVYRAGRDLFDRLTGLAALAVVAFAPVYVVYCQEARVYAMLPLCYLLALYLLHRLLEADSSPPLHLWGALAIVEALSIYLHYFAALGIVYLNMLLLVAWLRRRRFALRHWMGSQVLAALLFAPWVWNMIRHWDYFRSRGSVRGAWVVPPGPLAFAWRVWRFLVAGNEAAVEHLPLLSAGVMLLAALCGLALLLALLSVAPLSAAGESTRPAVGPPDRHIRLARRRIGGRPDLPSRRLWFMLAHALGPLALCFVAWQFWPDAQPRYTLVFSIPLFLAIGRLLVWLLTGRSGRWAGALLACTLALTFGVGLWAHTFDERFHKDDVRGVAAYLKEVTTAEDVVLIGPDDHSLPYYYDGPATVAMARDEPRADKVRHLREITAGKRQLFLVHWGPSKADLHGLQPFLLEQAGRLTARRDFRGLDVRVYALEDDVEPLPQLRPVEPAARFGPLLLTGVYYQPTAATDNAVAVALRWRLVEPASVAYKVVVMLTDGAGYRLSSTDVMILDEDGRQTYAWPAGAAETVNFYVVPVPVGTPPLVHRLAVGVYDAVTLERLPVAAADGQPSEGYELPLGEVALVPGKQFDGDPYDTWAGVDWETLEGEGVAQGVALEQFAVSPRAALPGEQVNVLLRWRLADATWLPGGELLRLSQADHVWTEVGSSLPSDSLSADRWTGGEVIVERRALTYPPQRGPADLTLAAGNGYVSLGQVWLDESRLLRELPPTARSVGVRIGDFAELLGYHLETDRLPAGQPFDLTLYWRALNDLPLQTQYTVFTQLLAADGHLIAQHDSPPAGNSRPTTMWIGGEVVEDEHRLTFQDSAYAGPAALIVGLYDSETIVRVPTAQGQDHVVLPEDVLVGPHGR